MTKTYLAAAAAAMLAMAPVGAAFMPVTAHAAADQYTVYFAMGSAKLDSAAMVTVDNAVSAIKDGNPTSIMVTGHADTVGGAQRNMQLSQQRAAAVRDAMIAKGVSPDTIVTDSVGENSLIVSTGDGTAEQANRAVVISYDGMMSGTTSATPVATAQVAPAKTWQRWQVEVGPYYGYSQSQDDNLIGGNLSLSYWVTENIAVGGEQAIFYPLDHNGFGGRSVGSIDYSINDITEVSGMGGLGMTLGVNYGYIYGSGVNDDFIYGPEIGFNLGSWRAKAAYDISDGGLDDSTVSVTLGYLMRF